MLMFEYIPEPEKKIVYDEDWNKLQKLKELCDYYAVNFSLCYEEACRTWSVDIDSCAKSECFLGKSKSFESAISDAINWLKGFKTGEHLKCTRV